MTFLSDKVLLLIFAGSVSATSIIVSESDVLDRLEEQTQNEQPLTEYELLQASKFLAEKAQEIDAGSDYKELQNALKALQEVIEEEQKHIDNPLPHEQVDGV